jgi:hypothetical protein
LGLFNLKSQPSINLGKSLIYRHNKKK